MNFSIGAKPEMVLIGIKITKINYQLNTEKRDYTSPLFKNYLSTKSYPNDGSVYTILANFNDDGYDYYIATNQEDAFSRESMSGKLEHIVIPAGLYLICKTAFSSCFMGEIDDMRRRAVIEWFSAGSYELRNAPEVGVCYWSEMREDISEINKGCCELWLPIQKKEV